jgi:iron complex outermembrane recepter protein
MLTNRWSIGFFRCTNASFVCVMKAVLLFLNLTFFYSAAVFSQISGSIISPDGTGLPMATISLQRWEDSIPVKAISTDTAGYFILKNLSFGSYRIIVSAVGYHTYNSSLFKIHTDTEHIDIGKIVLSANSKDMQEVVVRAVKPLYQVHTGGLVVNVENSVMTKGSSVLAVLQQSPGVLLDLRNNSLSLNGKSGVEIMLDGRLMNIPMEQLTQLLASMSADDIEKIELLATPPASYDAEGNAGIINIVRKKNKRKGSSGTVSLTGGYGQGGKGVASAGYGINKGNLNLDANYIFTYDRGASNLHGTSDQNFPPLGGATHAYFHNDNRNTDYSQNAGVHGEYDLSNKSIIGMNLSLNQEKGNSTVVNQRTLDLLPDSLSYFDASINGQSAMTNWIGSVYLEKKLRKNAEMHMDLDFISFRSGEPTEATSQFLNKDGKPAGGNDTLFSPQQRGTADTRIQIAVFKGDYKKVVSKKFYFEMGLKGSYTRNASHSGIESMVNDAWVSRPETSTDISLNEMLAAAYVSANTQLGQDLHLVTGLRYEFSRTGTTDLGVFFPYLSLSKPHWQFSYSKRISRPSYRDLSSFITYNDPLSVFTGNPFLKPTITQNLNLVYDNKSYSVSLLLSRDVKPIARWQIVESPNRDLMYIGPQNMEWQNNLTMQFNAPVKITGWWSMNLNLVGGWKQYREEYTMYPLQKTWFGYSGTMNQTFLLPKNYSVEISGWYNSSSYNGTTQTRGFGAVNGGIKKILNDKSGTLQFSVTDIFSSVHYITSYGSLTREAFDGSSHVVVNPESGISPIFRLTWSRSFGSANSKTSGNRISVSTDEQDRIK